MNHLTTRNQKVTCIDVKLSFCENFFPWSPFSWNNSSTAAFCSDQLIFFIVLEFCWSFYNPHYSPNGTKLQSFGRLGILGTPALTLSGNNPLRATFNFLPISPTLAKHNSGFPDSRQVKPKFKKSAAYSPLPLTNEPHQQSSKNLVMLRPIPLTE